MLNKVTLIGTLGKDAEVRSTTSGDEVVTLSVATSEQWKDKNSGEKREATEWHKVVVFGKTTAYAKTFNKGDRIYIEGQIKTRKWQDKETGKDRYSTEIVVQGFNGELKAISRKDSDRGQDNSGGNSQVNNTFREGSQAIDNKKAQERDDRDAFNDDIPF